MPQFKIYVKQIVRAIYVMEADNHEEAEQRFNEGLSGSLDITDTLDEEVTCIEEIEEEE